MSKIGRRGRDQQVLEAVLHETAVSHTIAEKRVAQMKVSRRSRVSDPSDNASTSPGDGIAFGAQLEGTEGNGSTAVVTENIDGFDIGSSALLRGNDFSLASVASVTLAVVERAREQGEIVPSHTSV